MDKTLTDKIVAWLNAPAHTEDADIMEGALMLLQLNRNRMLYMTISTNPKRFLKTVEYELKKFLPLRMKGKTCQDVRREADEFLSELRENGIDKEQSEGQDEMFETDDTVAPVRNGKREDHDQLPQSQRCTVETYQGDVQYMSVNRKSMRPRGESQGVEGNLLCLQG